MLLANLCCMVLHPSIVGQVRTVWTAREGKRYGNSAYKMNSYFSCMATVPSTSPPPQVSAFVAAFCNNIAYTASMLPLILQLANNPTLGLSLRPMAWSLALGVAYSANGSLVGAAANLVVAQLAKRAGCPITFIQFMKWGMPMLVITTFGAMIWVLIVYCWIGFSG